MYADGWRICPPIDLRSFEKFSPVCVKCWDMSLHGTHPFRSQSEANRTPALLAESRTHDLHCPARNKGSGNSLCCWIRQVAATVLSLACSSYVLNKLYFKATAQSGNGAPAQQVASPGSSLLLKEKCWKKELDSSCPENAMPVERHFSLTLRSNAKENPNAMQSSKWCRDVMTVHAVHVAASRELLLVFGVRQQTRKSQECNHMKKSLCPRPKENLKPANGRHAVWPGKADFAFVFQPQTVQCHGQVSDVFLWIVKQMWSRKTSQQ